MAPITTQISFSFLVIGLFSSRNWNHFIGLALVNVICDWTILTLDLECSTLIVFIILIFHHIFCELKKFIFNGIFFKITFENFLFIIDCANLNEFLVHFFINTMKIIYIKLFHLYFFS